MCGNCLTVFDNRTCSTPIGGFRAGVFSVCNDLMLVIHYRRSNACFRCFRIYIIVSLDGGIDGFVTLFYLLIPSLSTSHFTEYDTTDTDEV